MRIVIDLQKGAYPQKILNRFYKFSDLQKTFHLNMLALIDGIQPRVLSLIDVLNYFIEHRRKVVLRRTEYDLEKAKEIMKKNTRHLAKRQMTWFRKDKRIEWIDVDTLSAEEIKEKIIGKIKNV